MVQDSVERTLWHEHNDGRKELKETQLIHKPIGMWESMHINEQSSLPTLSLQEWNGIPRLTSAGRPHSSK